MVGATALRHFEICVCRNEGIEVKVVRRGEYDTEVVQWADAIISAGGKFAYISFSSYSPSLTRYLPSGVLHTFTICHPIELHGGGCLLLLLLLFSFLKPQILVQFHVL